MWKNIVKNVNHVFQGYVFCLLSFCFAISACPLRLHINRNMQHYTFNFNFKHKSQGQNFCCVTGKTFSLFFSQDQQFQTKESRLQSLSATHQLQDTEWIIESFPKTSVTLYPLSRISKQTRPSLTVYRGQTTASSRIRIYNTLMGKGRPFV